MRIYGQSYGGVTAVARLFAGCVATHLNPSANDKAWMTHKSLSTPGSEEMTL